MPRSSVTATSLRVSSFSAAAAAMPMPKIAAPSRSPENRAGIGAEFQRLVDRQERARALRACFTTSESRCTT